MSFTFRTRQKQRTTPALSLNSTGVYKRQVYTEFSLVILPFS